MAAATVAIFALLVTPAMAESGKPGGGSAVAVPRASMCVHDRRRRRQRVRHWPGFGGERPVTSPAAQDWGFAATAVGLTGSEYPMVAVWCYQNGATVYMSLKHPNEEFLLGGAWSPWVVNGGSADCKAVLYAYGWKAGQESVRELDDTYFWAAG